jgi:hypothetical protein
MVTANGQIVRVGPAGTPQVVGDYREKFSELQPIGTDVRGQPIIGQRSLSGGKAAYAPGGGVTVNTGANEVDRAAAPLILKDIQAARGSILSAQKANDLADRMTTLVNTPGVITGFGAGPRAAMASAANALFPGDSNALAKTQEAIKTSAELALAASAAMQGQGALSNDERALLARASGGDLNFTPEALTALMGAIKRASAVQAANAQDFLGNAAKNPRFAPYVEMYNAGGYRAPGDVPTMTPTAPEPGAAPAPLSSDESAELSRLRAKYGRTPNGQ